MRKILRWILFLMLFVALFCGVAILVASYFEAPVKQYFVKQLNKRLESPVHVEKIEFSLLAKFPSASLVLHDVWAEENVITIGEADTLAAFERLYLNFNVFDLIDGNYRLRGVEASNGSLRFKVDERGEDNFHIWKTTDDTTGFLLELDRVRLSNVDFRYVNDLRRQDYSLRVRDLVFKGRFSDEQYTMDVDGAGRVNHFIVKGSNYIDHRDVAIETALDVITSRDEYAFRSGEVLVDDRLQFYVSGKFIGDGIDLKLKGNELDIVQTLSLIPNEDRAFLQDYESTGVLDFECVINGAFSKTSNPYFEAKFAFDDASLKQVKTGLRLSDLKGSGSIHNGEEKRLFSTLLLIDTLSGKIGDGDFQTHFFIQNLEKPRLEGRLAYSSDLEELRKLLNLETIEYSEGFIEGSAKIKTVLQNLDSLRSSDFINANASGRIVLKKAKVKLKDDVRTYEVDSAHATIRDNNLVIDRYEGRINGCDVTIKGSAQNFLSYAFGSGGEALHITGDVVAGVITLEDLFPKREGSESKAVVSFLEKMTLNMNLISKEFNVGKFTATDLSGRLIMDAFKIQADRLHFKSQQGDVQGKAGVYRFGENQFGFRSEFDARKLDITELFQTFDNFSQDFLRAEHISGVANLKVEVQTFCDSVLNLNLPSLTASVDLEVLNGKLKDFKPLMNIADEVHQKRMMRLFIDTDELRKRLQNVAFDTIRNEISIRNQVVSIPAMAIRSSAIDINAEGTHHFDNRINYSLDFALSEILQLEDRKEPYNEFVQRDQKGRTRIYMNISGTSENPVVKVERTNINSVVRQDLEEEKQTVKALLKDEFGAFENDTTVRSYEEKKPEDIQMEFDPSTEIEKQESKQTEKSVPEKKATEKDKKSVLNKLIKNTEADKKKLREGEFEDDDF